MQIRRSKACLKIVEHDKTAPCPPATDGPYDGGTYPRDLVARLYRFVPIRFDGSCNYVDAAIAVGEFHDLDREVYWIGYVKGIETVGVNSIVQKTGRTTSVSKVATPSPAIIVTAMETKNASPRSGIMPMIVVTAAIDTGLIRLNPALTMEW